MLISCGIQWLAQVARYFSQAHLYLNGTSWLTSVWPLMMRLSATLTRCAAATGVGSAGCRPRQRRRRMASSSVRRGAAALPPARRGRGIGVVLLRPRTALIMSGIRLLAGFAFFETRVAWSHGACRRPMSSGFGQTIACAATAAAAAVWGHWRRHSVRRRGRWISRRWWRPW